MFFTKNQEEKFTIIITTRERSDTLFFTIKTCLAIKYNNYEILISDNASEDDTAEMVAGFQSEIIRYINTEKRVSMSENWNFALSHVSDGYITIIGDDDGMLPDSLRRANKIIKSTGTKALTWRKMGYSWPDHIYPPFRNTINIPLTKGYVSMISKEALEKLAKGKVKYDQLPCIYNSFIHYDVINAGLENCHSEDLFTSSSPDLYSAIIFALFTDKYIYSFSPFSINGASRHSNGYAQTFRHLNINEGNRFHHENRESTVVKKIFCYPQGLIASETYEALLSFKRNYQNFCDIVIDKKFFLTEIANEYSTQALDRPFLSESISELIQHAESEGIEKEIKNIIDKVLGTACQPKVVFGISFDSISFKGSYLGIKDVYRASVVSNYILKCIRFFPSTSLLRSILIKCGARAVRRAYREKRNQR